MKFSLKLNLDRANNLTKETTIFHSINMRGSRFRVTTEKKILPKDWSITENRVKKTHPNFNTINAILLKQQRELERQISVLIVNDKPVSKEIVLPLLSFGKLQNKSKSEAGIFKCFDMFILARKNHLSTSQIKHYKSAKNHLVQYCEKYKYSLSFESCSTTFYTNFVDYLLHEKDNHNSSVHKTTALMKTFLRWANDEGYNDNVEFKKFKAPQDYEKEVIALTVNELAILEAYQPNETLQKVKDLFLFECYTALRYTDIKNLRPENIKTDGIEVLTQKTKKIVFIPGHDRLKKILKKYVGNKTTMPQLSNQKMNDYLKDLAKHAGIDAEFTRVQFKGNKRIETKLKKYEAISTHTGRHTFITLSLQNGMDVSAIMRITGHTALKTFQKYIHYNKQVVTEQTLKAWN
jgi:site-specific recombinase XerD